MKFITGLVVVLLVSHAVLSTQSYCSDIQLNGIFINNVGIEGTPKKGWNFAFEVHAESVQVLSEGSVNSYIIEAESGKVVFESVLPFCSPSENVYCSLSFNYDDKNIHGYVPALIPEDSETDTFKAVIQITATTVAGEPVSICFEKTFESHDFNIEGCGACGHVMSEFRGVKAHSNGPNQNTGYSCGGNGAWGLNYQCVELVQRYYRAWFPVAYAKQMCAQKPGDMIPVNPPAPGDVYVTGNGYYGHTAIVVGSGPGFIDVMEQNGSCSGRARYSSSMASCFLRRRGAAPAPPSGGCPRHYTVVAGDNLTAIAARFGTTVAAIARANNIANPNLIYVGQRLVIPC